VAGGGAGVFLEVVFVVHTMSFPEKS
jgi:hypothetical protein